MEISQMASQLDSQAQAIRALVEGCSEQQARWKPDSTSWSMLEVINHLLDEEQEDFRARIELVLQENQGAWFRITPDAWVTARGYNQRELGPSVRAFLAAREQSLAWLRALGSVDWAREYEAPFGTIRAGDFMTSWVAHDVLHMRQLVELRWAYLVQAAQPYGLGYAGDW